MAMTNQATNTPKTGNTPKTTPSTPSPLVAGRDVKDFQFTPPMVDVRGWDVMLSSGDKLGRVDRILLDTSERKPRYLAVTPSDRAGQLLVPIGLGSVQAEKKQVVLNNLKPETLRAIPLLKGEVITREYERELFGAVTGRKASEVTQPQWYADPLFDPTKMFGATKTTVKS